MTNKTVRGLIKVELDYAPTTNGTKAKKWFNEHGMDFFGVGRRAWCSQYSTYFRGALGVAYTESGESFLFYQEDLQEASHDK
jgi:hypothetical protein